ncbi:hypothetical protein DV952_13290, partial [Staphylococcus pseudintermedius]|uniref:hypothetical protein n=1 Tax=Staphylococcus pseudintermedius TaxID=283734 RepID=UPI000E3A1439
FFEKKAKKFNGLFLHPFLVSPYKLPFLYYSGPSLFLIVGCFFIVLKLTILKTFNIIKSSLKSPKIVIIQN